MLEGGRKWTLTQQTFWTATVFAVVAFLVLLPKGDPMTALYWWTGTAGGLITIYSGLNVVQKGVQKNDPGAIP